METRKLSSSRLKLAVANFVMFQTGSVTSGGIFRNFLIAQSSKNMEKYELLRFVLSLVDRCV